MKRYLMPAPSREARMSCNGRRIGRRKRSISSSENGDSLPSSPLPIGGSSGSKKPITRPDSSHNSDGWPVAASLREPESRTTLVITIPR